MTADKILGRMRTLCSKREYCRSDIRSKILAAASGESVDVEGILDVLGNEGFLDDSRYARAFCRDKSSLQGWGAVKIRFALSGKGIEKSVIDSAMGEIDTASAMEKLEKTVAAKARSLKDDPQARLKLLRFALSRGYSYDEASSAVEKIKI